MLLRNIQILCFLGVLVELGFCQKSTRNYNYITWNDIKVDELRDSMSKNEIKGKQNWNNSGIIVVDKSGKTGDSVTVQGAVDLVPYGNSQRIRILILPGIYRERVTVPSSKPYISFIGTENQASNTVITWNNKASDKNSNGVELGTFGSATITIYSDYFCASQITFENTVVAIPGGLGMQAVALRVAAERAMFYKVNVLGSQDTLLDETGSHYFYHCLIQGSVDFIFGNARSLYQNSVLRSIANRSGAIAAHHRNSPDENTGFSFLNCTISGSGMIYLGRAWGPYSRAVYSYCDMGDVIAPEGWSDWGDPERQKTTVFGEFQCIGTGANTTRRVPWAKSFRIDDARPFLDMEFIDGNKWLRL
ncbi:pectinesterase QRT1 [Beta vulgaris subsp. vulgaris]|uniref:pectinesterase QRT1 n=1 Tax=Beta vulgaris subsp. vulgaris TaxID=3555 RepID=UPI0020372B6F|nr:pectinesterase QRT1 [Beta vulgaris subsp. vulgaris]